MRNFILIFIGGGTGSIMRYVLHNAVHRFLPVKFPYGTFTVNIIACLLLGLAVGLGKERSILSDPSYIFITVGICGGFSTFSTFSGETLSLFQQGNYSPALLYVLLSVITGIAAVALGIFTSKFVMA